MTFPHTPDDKPSACERCDDTGIIESIHDDPVTGILIVDRERCACGAEPMATPGRSYFTPLVLRD